MPFANPFNPTPQEIAEFDLQQKRAEKQREETGKILEDIRNKERENQTFGQTLVTAAEGFARGATFGLSDMAGRAIGGEEYAKNAAARRQYNPLALPAEIVGVVAPLLVTKGATTGAAGAARGALGLAGIGRAAAAATPAALAARGAELAGLGAGRMISSPLASAAVRYGTEGAIYSAMQGAGADISEVALSSDGDLDSMAEEVAIKIKDRTLGRLITGAALGAGGAAVSKGVSAAASKLSTKLEKQMLGIEENAATINKIASDLKEIKVIQAGVKTSEIGERALLSKKVINEELSKPIKINVSKLPKNTPAEVMDIIKTQKTHSLDDLVYLKNNIANTEVRNEFAKHIDDLHPISVNNVSITPSKAVEILGSIKKIEKVAKTANPTQPQNQLTSAIVGSTILDIISDNVFSAASNAATGALSSLAGPVGAVAATTLIPAAKKIIKESAPSALYGVMQSVKSNPIPINKFVAQTFVNTVKEKARPKQVSKQITKEEREKKYNDTYAGLNDVENQASDLMHNPDPYAPVTSYNLAQIQLNTAAYLRATAPMGLGGDKLQPSYLAQKPNPVEVARWERRVEIAKNPLSVFEIIKKGELTKEHADTLKALYPNTYNKIKNAYMEKLYTNTDPISPSLRSQIELLFDLAPPERVLDRQSVYQTQQPQQPQQQTNQKPISANANSFMTQTQKIGV